jgi:hypothetical protein
MGATFLTRCGIDAESEAHQATECETSMLSRYSFDLSDFGAFRMLFFNTSNTDAVS